MARGLLSGGPRRLKTRPIGQVDIQPAVHVVIEECQAAALCLNDVFLVLHAAPHVYRVYAGLFGDINKRDGGAALSLGTWSSAQQERARPLM